MKCLIIGGNRFVGLRLSHFLDQKPDVDLHIVNRSGQAAHTKKAVLYKSDRNFLENAHLDKDWDVVIDFACFNQREAVNACKFFGKVGQYIFISTSSVYDGGAALSEQKFSPAKWPLDGNPKPDYQDGKRRAEAVFAQQAQFPVLAVRFPFILGPDDYTHRLEFHIERMRLCEEIYIPNTKARISLVHSQDAMEFLAWTIGKPIHGPINVASADPISLAGLLGQIELVIGEKPVLAKNLDTENESPYAPPGDFYLDTSVLQKAGFQARPIQQWLPSLIGNPESANGDMVH